MKHCEMFDAGVVKPFDPEEFKILDKEQKRRIFVAQNRPGYRVGQRAAALKIEHSLYQPLTDSNKDFRMLLTCWPEDSDMVWTIFVCTDDKEAQIREIFNNCGLRVADGIPMVVGKGNFISSFSSRTKLVPETQTFPMESSRVFNLEYINNHLAYNSSKYVKKLIFIESFLCDKLQRTKNIEHYREVVNLIYESWTRTIAELTLEDVEHSHGIPK